MRENLSKCQWGLMREKLAARNYLRLQYVLEIKLCVKYHRREKDQYH